MKTIDEYPDASFDLVLVDGRARLSCLSHTVRKIRTGGYLVLDDCERTNYTKAISLLDRYPHRVFCGLMPYHTPFSHTYIWRIDQQTS